MNKITRILLYLLGLLIMAIGIAFSFESDLGSSPISSLPYAIYQIWGVDIGLSTVIFHLALVLIQFILLRKAFKAKFLLQIPAGIIFGYFTNVGIYIVSFIPKPSGIFGSILFLILSIIILAFGIFIYLPPNIVQLAGEGAMQAIAITTKKPFPTIKVLFDSSMVISAFILCGVFIQNPLASVGIGTVISAVLIGTVLKYIVIAFRKLTGIEVDLKKM